MKYQNSGNKKPRVNTLANIFLFLGFLGLIFSAYLIFQRYNPQKLSFNLNYNTLEKAENSTEVLPVGIVIESQKISLPVYPAEIKNNEWEATNKGVSYLKNSVVPGEKGNSIMYGHNWPNLLGRLPKVKPGEKITVNFSDNSSKDFVIEYTAQVDPGQTSILDNSSDNRITLYTCTGFLDNKRFVVVAKLLV